MTKKAKPAPKAKLKLKAMALTKAMTAQGNRVMHGGQRPPYICVAGPGGCLRFDYNPTLDIFGPDSTQCDCSTCQYF
jgi:hypothetical protein